MTDKSVHDATEEWVRHSITKEFAPIDINDVYKAFAAGAQWQSQQAQVPEGCSLIPLDPRNGTPLITNEMKKIHIGEYEFAFPSTDEDGEEILQSVTVPWDLCKAIYKAMAQTAMLTAAPQPAETEEKSR